MSITEEKTVMALRRNMEKKQAEAQTKKVVDACFVVGEVLIRGYVSKVACRACGRARWNDGTPCKNLNERTGKICAVYFGQSLDMQDEWREG